MVTPDFDLDYRPKLGARMDFGIGIVGAGAIVNAAHLPAYRKAGFKIAGIMDVNTEIAQQTAKKFEVSTVYPDLAAMISDPQVDIIDIAVPPWHQRKLVEEITASGKHVLCQKPLSNVFSEAVSIVDSAERANITLAVNQQMRWDQAIRASCTLIGRGWIGEPVAATIDINILTDWSAWPWLLEVDGLDLMYHSIHYLDSLRSLFGEPRSVSTSGFRYPGQAPIGETRTVTVCDYSDTFGAVVSVNHNNWTEDRHATLRIDGTEGYIRGTLGLLYNYPHGRPDTLEFHSTGNMPHLSFKHSFEEMWVPDSFIGPMGELMKAIEEERLPETHGRDNLKTLQLVHAGYLSMAEGRSVRPSEITD